MRFWRRKKKQTKDEQNEAGFLSLGPECFIGPDRNVISYKGENFYRACSEWVSDLPEGGGSFCVLRVDHPGAEHEDYDGRLRL